MNISIYALSRFVPIVAAGVMSVSLIAPRTLGPLEAAEIVGGATGNCCADVHNHQCPSQVNFTCPPEAVYDLCDGRGTQACNWGAGAESCFVHNNLKCKKTKDDTCAGEWDADPSPG